MGIITYPPAKPRTFHMSPEKILTSIDNDPYLLQFMQRKARTNVIYVLDGMAELQLRIGLNKPKHFSLYIEKFIYTHVNEDRYFQTYWPITLGQLYNLSKKAGVQRVYLTDHGNAFYNAVNRRAEFCQFSDKSFCKSTSQPFKFVRIAKVRVGPRRKIKLK